MAEMSITRGLSELKLLANRIDREINSSKLSVGYKKSGKVVDGVNNVDEFVAKAKASYQSVLDLIERRKAIKSAIVESNAKTLVTIAGKQMTVASAIERKDSIQFEQDLLTHMRHEYTQSLNVVRINNAQVQAKLDELLTVSFGRENKAKVTTDEIASISKPYIDQNEFVLLDPLKLEDKIKALENDINEFIHEVDFVLSESNTITKIEV
jgi:hypothetical protein